MAELERYVLLSKEMLSAEDRGRIIESVPGVFLTWVGDEKEVIKEENSDIFRYNLNCFGLKEKNLNYFTKNLGLRVESPSLANEC